MALQREKSTRPNHLDKTLCLDNFMAGQANHMALTACKELIKGNTSMTPLFIYGSTGVGKTHLCHATGNDYLRRYPDKNVLYVTAKNFTNDVVQACRLSRYDLFEQRYQSLDMLIIDDIQHLSGNKKRTQEELLCLLNQMKNTDKTVIIGSNCPSSSLDNICTHLVSRFSAGLAIFIDAPEMDLRCRIVAHKSGQHGHLFPKEVINTISSRCGSDIRKIEGATKRLIASAEFQKKTVSLRFCEKVLSDVISRRSGNSVQIKTIKEHVARFYAVQIADVESKKRHRSITTARYVAIFLCRRLTTMSLPEIGAAFGKRNHSNVVHACKRIEKKLQDNADFHKTLQRLQSDIESDTC